MIFLRNIRVAKHTTSQIAGRCSVISPISHRMVSYYNAQIAGLTEEQVEVARLVHCERTC